MDRRSSAFLLIAAAQARDCGFSACCFDARGLDQSHQSRSMRLNSNLDSLSPGAPVGLKPLDHGRTGFLTHPTSDASNPEVTDFNPPFKADIESVWKGCSVFLFMNGSNRQQIR